MAVNMDDNAFLLGFCTLLPTVDRTLKKAEGLQD